MATIHPATSTSTHCPLDLILEVRDSDVKRKYDESSLKRSDFWKSLVALANDDVSFYDPKITQRIRSEPALFFELQPVPWYMDALGNSLTKDQATGCRLIVKACKDYHFYDVYRETAGARQLVCEPFFHHIKDPNSLVGKLDEVPLAEPTKEGLRGLADTLLFLAPHVIAIRTKHPNLEESKPYLESLFQWFQLNLNINAVTKEGDASFRLSASAEIKWDSSAVKYEVQSINIHSVTENKAKPILMASSNFRQAVERLAEVWHDSAAKSVILSAGSGSGKEELKEVLAYGLRLQKREQLIELSAPELALHDDPLKVVYDRLNDNGLITGSASLKYLNATPVVLFFDEIHQVGMDRIRTLLLRMMESGQLTVNGELPLKCKGTLYLFAASKRVSELRTTCAPLDFWTRLEHTVEMVHPLELETKKERHEVLRQYFCLFWRRAAEARIEAANAAGEQGTVRMLSQLMEDKCLEAMAVEFATTLGSPLIPTISVRILRSIVGRLLSKAIYHLRTNKGSNPQHITECIDGWIVTIFKELGPDIRTEGLF